MKMSINNNLILTPYKKTRELEQKAAVTGFMVTSQKVSIEYLELLVDTQVKLGDNGSYWLLEPGDKVFFKESTLFTQAWAKEVYTNEEFPDGFIIANASDVLYVDRKNDSNIK